MSAAGRGAPGTGTAAALAAWREQLGAAAVLTQPADLAPYTANVSGWRRSLVAVLRPRTPGDVLEIVRVANRCGTPLYPVSRGCNWGLGSRLPVRDGAALVDLSGLNRIREVNVPYHYAVVEPGVTQQQLYAHLRQHDLPLMLNVIGSGQDTSLIGNALERGIGYFDSRAESLSALEVVLGNGTLIRTGFGHFPANLVTHHYRHGLGPGLDGLFAQSNYGIVTGATVDLMPRPEYQLAMAAAIPDDATLPALVDALADLRRQGVIQTVAHLGNRPRALATLVPLVAEELARGRGGQPETYAETAAALLTRCGFQAWSAVVGLHGPQAQVLVNRDLIRRRLRGISRPRFFTARGLAAVRRVAAALRFLPFFADRLAVLNAQEPLFGWTLGVPSDAALKSVHWSAGTYARDGQRVDLDQTRSGYLLYLPFTPLSGEHAGSANAIITRVFAAHGFVPYVTMNIVNPRTLEHVINVAFDLADAEATRRAQACVAALDDEFRGHGYLPYRVSIEQMARYLDPADPFWQTVRDLKLALDPNHIIAPGRYNLV